MLPHIDAHQRGERRGHHQRAVLIGGGDHIQLALGIGDQPGPATAEAGHTRGGQLLLKFGETFEGGVDRLGQGAGRFAASLGAHGLPEERVVVVATTVVDHRLADGRGNFIDSLEDVGDRLLEPIRVTSQGLVQVVDIGLVVAAPVNFHGFGVDVRFEGVERVRKFGQGESGLLGLDHCGDHQGGASCKGGTKGLAAIGVAHGVQSSGMVPSWGKPPAAFLPNSIVPNAPAST